MNDLFTEGQADTLSPYRRFVVRHNIGIEPISETESPTAQMLTRYRATLADEEAVAGSEKDAVFDLAQKLKLDGREEVNW